MKKVKPVCIALLLFFPILIFAQKEVQPFGGFGFYASPEYLYNNSTGNKSSISLGAFNQLKVWKKLWINSSISYNERHYRVFQSDLDLALIGGPTLGALRAGFEKEFREKAWTWEINLKRYFPLGKVSYFLHFGSFLKMPIQAVGESVTYLNFVEGEGQPFTLSKAQLSRVAGGDLGGGAEFELAKNWMMLVQLGFHLYSIDNLRIYLRSGNQWEVYKSDASNFYLKIGFGYVLTTKHLDNFIKRHY